jgi:hypothetical protein
LGCSGGWGETRLDLARPDPTRPTRPDPTRPTRPNLMTKEVSRSYDKIGLPLLHKERSRGLVTREAPRLMARAGRGVYES